MRVAGGRRIADRTNPPSRRQAQRPPAASIERVGGSRLTLAELTELPLAGIDLRRTADNEWYCFEINPSPGFSYYENATGQPIADAIAGLLLY